MRFKKIGKTYQLRTETAEDLEGILDLDESLWVATSAPRDGFRCDPQFLALVDADHNGRIYTAEMKGAIRWLLDRLADRTGLSAGTDTLPLSAIRSETPEGQALVDSARYILESLGAKSAETISLGQVRAFAADMLSRPLNGDGIIRPDAAADPETAGFVNDVIACVGGIEDASGHDGINEDHVRQFISAITGYPDWKAKSEIPAGQTSTAIMPLGPETPAAYEVFRAHAEKVDLFFTLQRLARFEPRAAAQIGWQESDLQGLDLSRPEVVQTYLKQAPLAKASADRALCLSEEAVNPAYREWLSALKRQVLQPVLGGDTEELSEADWKQVKSVLAPYAAYLGRKKGAEVETLPVEKLRQYSDGPFEQKVLELIRADKAVAAALDGVREVEQLLLYHQNLMRLANNFVSFPELYATDKRALFEMGSAVIDGSWFKFAVKVDDIASHSAMAKTSHIFIMYLEVTGGATGEKFAVAVPATSGTKGNLNVGKQGIFFDTGGRAHDVRVVQIVENPISVREALVLPFVRLWGFVAGKIEALSGKAEKGLQTQLAKATPIQAPAQAAPAPAAAAGGPAGLVIAISVAVAALGSAFAFIMSKLGERPFLIVFGLAGAVLLVVVPVSLIAIFKLRRQDLSALLEGCGWAINASMRLTRSQRKHFTTRVAYPKGAEGGPWPPWVRIVSVIVILAAILAGVHYGARVLVQRQQAKQMQDSEEGQEGTPAQGQEEVEGDPAVQGP